MLTNEQLRSIPINSNALECVPESVAREHDVLAISDEAGQLHLILPALADMQLSLLEENLRFILGRAFSYDTANADELSRVVDLHYTAAYSTVQNCTRAFRSFCPKHWADLTLTTDPKTRWCSVCDRSVTFCLTDEEIDQLSQNGKCVAFYSRNEHVELLGLVDLDFDSLN